MLRIIIAAAAAGAAVLIIGLAIRGRRNNAVVRGTVGQALASEPEADIRYPANEARERISAAEPVDRTDSEGVGLGAGGEPREEEAPSVLIVDDQPMIRIMLREVLESSGVTVRDAASGQDALELAGRHRFDLLLLDMKMPGMDGIELLRRLRQWDGNPNANAPCAFISALNDSDKRREAEALGATAFIVKPFDIFEVRDYVLQEAEAARRQQVK